MKKKKIKTVNLFEPGNYTTESSCDKYPLKNYKLDFENYLKNKPTHITDSELIKSLIDGIFVKSETDENIFVHMPRPKIYYDIEFCEFCYDVNYGKHIYKVSEYLKTWYFYNDAQRL